jgi:putative spermidine/putrescine transport system ATP-binding protein
MAMPPAVRFDAVSRHFGEARALDGISFEIADGEFFSLLGPSGSGKTTCLRLIAGFDQPTSGTIWLAGEPVAGIAPYNRNVNTVFQDYALFPHMSVADNIAYGPMIRGEPRPARLKRAQDMLELVNLAGYGARRPAQLSGGQRQRVALARALINEPRILLLDEPLGALDLKLREQMQGELKSLQRRLGITFAYVTHDQQEALSMSDRIAVFNAGRIEQIAAPEEIYNRPATEFTAAFVGVSNLIVGAAAERLAGKAGSFSVRPEYIEPATPANTSDDAVTVEATVSNLLFQGPVTRVEMTTADGLALIMTRPSAAHDLDRFAAGARVSVRWRRDVMTAIGSGGS